MYIMFDKNQLSDYKVYILIGNTFEIKDYIKKFNARFIADDNDKYWVIQGNDLKTVLEILENKPLKLIAKLHNDTILIEKPVRTIY